MTKRTAHALLVASCRTSSALTPDDGAGAGGRRGRVGWRFRSDLRVPGQRAAGQRLRLRHHPAPRPDPQGACCRNCCSVSRSMPVREVEGRHGGRGRPCVCDPAQPRPRFRRRQLRRAAAVRLARPPSSHRQLLPGAGFTRAMADRAVAMVSSPAWAPTARWACARCASAGGLTLAQQPESARFDPMPASAIAAEVVDIVALPGEMAARRGRLVAQYEPTVFPAEAADQRRRAATAVPSAAQADRRQFFRLQAEHRAAPYRPPHEGAPVRCAGRLRCGSGAGIRPRSSCCSRSC